MTDAPQIYLILPERPDPDALARVLDGAAVACLRLAGGAEGADVVRAVAHERDVAVVIEGDAEAAARLGLDGVHLAGGARGVARAREALGDGAIVGAHCGASRHDGMTAGERGADYVSFDADAPHDLFAWWSELIELPVVAEGLTTPAEAERLGPVADWLALAPSLWGAPDPLEALRALTAALRAPT